MQHIRINKQFHFHTSLSIQFSCFFRYSPHINIHAAFVKSDPYCPAFLVTATFVCMSISRTNPRSPRNTGFQTARDFALNHPKRFSVGQFADSGIFDSSNTTPAQKIIAHRIAAMVDEIFDAVFHFQKALFGQIFAFENRFLNSFPESLQNLDHAIAHPVIGNVEADQKKHVQRSHTKGEYTFSGSCR